MIVDELHQLSLCLKHDSISDLVLLAQILFNARTRSCKISAYLLKYWSYTLLNPWKTLCVKSLLAGRLIERWKPEHLLYAR